jgi:hypothetical protein
MPAYTQGFVRARRIDAEALGANAVTLNGGLTTESVDISGYNQLKLSCIRVNNSGTATSFYFETSEDGGTTWLRRQSGAVSGGTETLNNHTVSRAITQLAFDYYLPIVGDEGDLLRVVFTDTSDAADFVTAQITLGVV